MAVYWYKRSAFIFEILLMLFGDKDLFIDEYYFCRQIGLDERSATDYIIAQKGFGGLVFGQIKCVFFSHEKESTERRVSVLIKWI